MEVYSKINNRFKNLIWKENHRAICKRNVSRLENKEVSIISMNCTGGILYHDLGLQFQSPTINMFFRAEDFIRFCERLDYYLTIDTMKECTDQAILQRRNYPVAWLEDIKLFLVHYRTIDEAQAAWNRRKTRVCKDRIVIVATDRDGMTDTLKDRFEKLPFPKVMFVHQPDERHPNCFYITGFEHEDEVGIITEPIGWYGQRPIDQFDFVDFLNQAVQQGSRGK